MIKETNDREKLEETILASQNYFEKNLRYLNAGALVLSIGFVEKVVTIATSNNAYWLITSWVLFAFSLMINLISHLISVQNSTNALNEHDEKLEIFERIKRILKRNRFMFRLNLSTYLLFLIGIISLLIFCSLNILKS
ncbi:hypothetical protein ACS6L2_13205 [Aquirufa ecclesiirivi]